MKTVKDLKVGDIVWWVNVNRRGLNSSGTVEKIGNKLITTTSGKVFRKDTMRTNDAYGHDHLILDIEDYEKVQAHKYLIGKIKSDVCFDATIPYEDVLQAAQLLGIDVKDTK